MRQRRELRSTGEIIDALGGNPSVQKLTKRKGGQHITNWRASGYFPPDTFLIITKALRERRLRAPASLWRIVDPDQKRNPVRRASGPQRASARAAV